MAITRRQFVTRLGALAATVGFSQADASILTEAFAGNSTNLGGAAQKPRVIWIHGAECTGCSTSLLGILEKGSGKPFPFDENATVKGYTTMDALGLAGVTSFFYNDADPAKKAFPTLSGTTRTALFGSGADKDYVNIADVVIDVIDLQYHETVMSMGGDLAAKWLKDEITNDDQTFVLVVEGALQDHRNTGAWNTSANSAQPWCSIAMEDDGTEYDMPKTVARLAQKTNCAAIIGIGQCASYGGYPGCKPQISSTDAGFDVKQSQTGAKGVYDFLAEYTADPGAVDIVAATVNAAKDKVVNVPGCPTNPWWFVLTVVMTMVDLVNASHPLGVLGAGGLPSADAIDYGRRLKRVYPIPVHSAYCSRYPYYNQGIYATKPGQKGCLQKLGCKGIGTMSLCGAHGWNNQQPENDSSNTSLSHATGHGLRGGHCTTAGHPCMGCTEKGYPDSFVPFVKR